MRPIAGRGWRSTARPAWTCPCCFRCRPAPGGTTSPRSRVKDGHVTRIEEYLDSAKRSSIRGARGNLTSGPAHLPGSSSPRTSQVGLQIDSNTGEVDDPPRDGGPGGMPGPPPGRRAARRNPRPGLLVTENLLSVMHRPRTRISAIAVAILPAFCAAAMPAQAAGPTASASPTASPGASRQASPPAVPGLSIAVTDGRTLARPGHLTTTSWARSRAPSSSSPARRGY